MNSKTRSKLNGMAMKLDPLVIIGKNGITQSVLAEISGLLDSRELVKIQLLKSVDSTSRETAEIIAADLKAEVITAIGNRFVLYRKSAKEGVKHILDE